MTEIPPSRYQVVERGRRLVVIDRRTGAPASPEHGSMKAPSRRSEPAPVAQRPVEKPAPRRIDDRSGAAILTTTRLYDLKAPRSIVMDNRFNDTIGKAIGGWAIGLFMFVSIALVIFPWLLVAPVIALTQPGVRAAIRKWTTARLDEVQAAS